MQGLSHGALTCLGDEAGRERVCPRLRVGAPGGGRRPPEG